MDIKAILKINEYGNGKIESATSNQEQINISTNPYSNSISIEPFYETTSDTNLDYFDLYTPFGSRKKLAKKYEGYIFPKTMSIGGESNLVIEIKGENILSLILYFDRNTGQYPIQWTLYDSNNFKYEYSIDNDIITIKSYINNVLNETTTKPVENNYIIKLENMVSGINTKKIEILKWSRANYRMVIKKIESIEVDIELNKRFINKINSLSEIAVDSKLSYGVLSNTGKIDIRDYNGTIYKNAKLGYLDSHIYNLYLYINGQQQQTHISVEAPLYNKDNTIILQLSDILKNWNNIIIPSQTYHPNFAGYSLIDILSNSLSNAGINYNDILDLSMEIKVGDIPGSTFAYGETTVYTYLNYIKINNTISESITIPEMSLLDFINNICNIAQLQGCIDKNGKLKLFNARPLMTSNELKNCLVIPYSKQLTKLKYDIIVSNRYDEVNIR